MILRFEAQYSQRIFFRLIHCMSLDRKANKSEKRI